MLFIIALIAFSCNKNPTDMKIKLAGKEIKIELADDPQEQIQGLSGRASLGENEGMLFIYQNELVPNFWMKGMNFAIDIVWVKDNEVVDITPNATPEPGVEEKDLKRYRPKEPINKVLELPAGWGERNNLKIKDRVDFFQVKR